MQQDKATSATPHTGLARFLDACHLRQPDATPVWFMRQAGHCLIEYRDLLRKYGIMRIAKTPELCAQVTLMPVQVLGVDVAVLYADIMLPVEEMGVALELNPQIGPIIQHPLRTQKDIEALRVFDSTEIAPFVMQAIRIVRTELAGKQAVLGFSGSPFTLACYMIEGQPSRDYAVAKGLMYGQPELWHALMEKLTTMIINYLTAQIHAGVDAVQLFDSWIGTVGPDAYQRFVQPYNRRIFEAIRQVGTPTIHFGTDSSALLDEMKEDGASIIGVDWRVNLDDAWARIGYDRGIQGNLDPTIMLTSWPVIEAEMRNVLKRAAGRPGHIFSLGHRVHTETSADLLRRLVDAVHEETQR
jgi:uroporphyrinogen decarboxylase